VAMMRNTGQPMTVGDLMSGDIVAVDGLDPVEAVREILLASGLHALPVLDEGARAIGIVTLADLFNAEDEQQPVSSVMAQPIVTIDVQASLAEAASVMKSEYLHHLIVTEGLETIGILSTFDLLTVFVEPAANRNN